MESLEFEFSRMQLLRWLEDKFRELNFHRQFKNTAIVVDVSLVQPESRVQLNVQ